MLILIALALARPASLLANFLNIPANALRFIRQCAISSTPSRRCRLLLFNGCSIGAAYMPDSSE